MRALSKICGRELESRCHAGYGPHDYDWQHALAAGRKLFGAQFANDVTLYLIEAASVDFGLELSQPVKATAQQLIEEIGAIIVRRDAALRHAPPGRDTS